MKLSLILMCWNTSHLLARTLQTLQKQTLDDWELLIVDDNSEDDVPLVLRQNGGGLPIRYYRLEHDMGMRGNTFSINFGVDHAQGDIVMWSTPEVMLPPDALRTAHATHSMMPDDLLWVTIPSHGLTAEVQLRIDEADWQSDLHNIKHLVESCTPGDWSSVWFHLNFHEDGRTDKPRKATYGNNQTVAVLRDEWLREMGSFPYFLDYGSDDPWVSRARRQHAYVDVTLWDQEAYHQWHTTCQYWMALGKAPNWNRHGHTTSNLLSDPRVPKTGTCQIWDGGDTSPLSDKEVKAYLQQQGEMVRATGFKERQE